jgi:hypothetical protein
MVEGPEACVHGNSWIAAIGAACAELPGLARNPRTADPAPAAAPRTRAARTAARTSSGRAAAVPGTGTIDLVPEPKPVAELTKGGV